MRHPNNMRTIFGWALVGSLAFVPVACGSGEAVCGPGHDEVPALVEEGELDTFWVGSIGVDELKVTGLEAVHDTLVQANFNDFSEYMVGLAPRQEYLPDYPACYVITGLPTTEGAPIPLSVESVTFTGLSESVVLEPNEFDQLPVDLLPQRGFAAEEVGIEVSSAGGETDFPAFSDTVLTPAMPVPGRVGDTTWGDLMVSETPSLGINVERAHPLVVEWEPGDGDVVEVKIIPNANTSTEGMKLRCITFDDGCLEIPPGALGSLALDDATNFKLRMERHHYTVHSIEEGGSVKAAAIIDASASLETIVVR